MKYTTQDLYEGMELRCQNDSLVANWWTTGKSYIVFKTMNDDNIRVYGPYYLIADTGHMRDTDTILKGLNKESAVTFTPVKEEKEMTKFAKITGYAGTGDSDKEVGLCIGSVYELVEYDPQGNSYIYLNEDKPRYYVADTQFTLVSKPPFKIGDKVRVLSNRSLATDENKVYYNDGDIAVVGEVHWLGVNKSYGRVRLGTHKCGNWIDFNCIELVEKEEPTLKANVNVDVKEAIQAKIEQLRTDAEIISNKRNRMEWQMFMLNSKANKLEEVLETIKEFE